MLFVEVSEDEANFDLSATLARELEAKLHIV
jgi:hypothetical protein